MSLNYHDDIFVFVVLMLNNYAFQSFFKTINIVQGRTGQQKYIRLLKQHLQAFIRSRVHVQINLAKCVFWPKFPQVSHDGLTRFVG